MASTDQGENEQNTPSGNTFNYEDYYSPVEPNSPGPRDLSRGNSGASSSLSSSPAVALQAAALRFLLCAVGNLLAVPFVCGAVLLGYPACFQVQVGSGLLAELYLGQTLAVVSDFTLTDMPPALRTPSVALFMLCVTVLGGNIPLLVPYVETVWGFTEVAATFEAAPAYNSSADPSLCKKFLYT
jgi:hypothetical protein